MKFDNNTIQYAGECEQICDEHFAFLTGKTGWFNYVVKNPENSTTDYKTIDTKYRTVTIELKTRNIKPFQYDDIMIEPSKYCTLTGSTTEKSWYICFFENEKVFWISDVKSELNDKIRIKKNVQIKNKKLGDNYTYIADRYFINSKYGHYYIYSETENKYLKLN